MAEYNFAVTLTMDDESSVTLNPVSGISLELAKSQLDVFLGCDLWTSITVKKIPKKPTEPQKIPK